MLRMAGIGHRYPVLVTGSEIAAALLGCSNVTRGGQDLLDALDRPEPSSIGPIVVFDPVAALRERFPVAHLREPERTRRMEDAIFEGYDQFAAVVTRQSQIADRVCDLLRRSAKVDAVVLVVVDGLSYHDIPQREEALPCLVDGPTTTGFGYPNSLGSPPLPVRLFAMGFKRFVGFSYWDPHDNELAGSFFSLMGSVHRFKNFSEVLAKMSKMQFRRTYVQVGLAGLDQLAHNHRDTPPVQSEVETVLSRLREVEKLLAERVPNSLLVATADHGILWGHQDDLLVNPHLHQDGFASRYASRAVLLPKFGRVFPTEAGSYTCLRYPYVSSPLRANEWGTHGGISCRESLVPLWLRKIGGART